MAPAVLAAPGGELLQVAGRNHRRPLVRVVRHGGPISSLFLGRTHTRHDRAPAPAPPGGHAGSGSAAEASTDAGGGTSSHGRGHLVASRPAPRRRARDAGREMAAGGGAVPLVSSPQGLRGGPEGARRCLLRGILLATPYWRGAVTLTFRREWLVCGCSPGPRQHSVLLAAE